MRRSILVELDALLDTRIGAMQQFSPSVAGKMVKDPNYYLRLIDDWERYGAGTTLLWRNVYNGRTVETLKRSKYTMMLGLLAEEILRPIYAQAMDSPVLKGADVTVNTWPYQLDEIECREIALALQYLIIPWTDEGYAFDTQFNTISLPPEQLTLDEIREKWSVVILYNFHAWYDLHAKSLLASERAARLSEMYVPALFREMPDRKHLTGQDGSTLNPFHETQRWMAMSIQLRFWEAQAFSLPCPFDPVKQKKR